MNPALSKSLFPNPSNSISPGEVRIDLPSIRPKSSRQFVWHRFVRQYNLEHDQSRIHSLVNYIAGFCLSIVAHWNAAFEYVDYKENFIHRDYWREKNPTAVAKPLQIPKEDQPSSRVGSPKKSGGYSKKQIALGLIGVAAAAYGLWQSGALHLAGSAVSDLYTSWFSQPGKLNLVPDISHVPPPCPTPSSVLTPEQIHVFTSYTTTNPERLEMSRKVVSNQMDYCKSRGYQYEVYERNLADLGLFDSSLPYWSKIAGMNHLLNKGSKAKWFVWLDDDAVVLKQDVRMEDLIQIHGKGRPNKHVIVTQDIPNAGTSMNTGVLIVRNSNVSRRFFKDIWEMRHQRTDNGSGAYRYSNCPDQRCLHEQAAMHDLLNKRPEYRQYVNIIPQRTNGIGLNTFQRFDHLDYNRNDWNGRPPMSLNYNDPLESQCKPNVDFICQCPGLATKGKRSWYDPTFSNLRAECIDDLLRYAAKKP